MLEPIHLKGKNGECIMLGDTIIPAANIQLEGDNGEKLPGWLTIKINEHHYNTSWYGQYFEVMFENGDLWSVDLGSKEEEIGVLIIEEYVNYKGRSDEYTKTGEWTVLQFNVDKRDFAWMFQENVWEEFLDQYKRKLRVIDVDGILTEDEQFETGAWASPEYMKKDVA